MKSAQAIAAVFVWRAAGRLSSCPCWIWIAL